MMSKKYYKIFAELCSRHSLTESFLSDLENVLQEDNSRFDRGRFEAWIQKTREKNEKELSEYVPDTLDLSHQ